MKKGGGILRKKNVGTDGEVRRSTASSAASASLSSGRVVTFSTPRNDAVAVAQDYGHGSYDSDDEVEDAILASGDGLGNIQYGGKYDDDANGDIDMNDDSAAFRSAAEIEEAKRRRGRARLGFGESEERGTTNTTNADFGVGSSSSGWKDVDDNDDDHHEGGQGFSLITDQSADPDAYESNAAGNASCPVEPFNMDAEKEGGMGYFDGDTYIFRQNKKPIDGEADAWLDGSSEEEEGGSDGGGGGGGGGILNSTAIWKPPSLSKANDPSKRRAKFVGEDDSPEHLGRRLATLLEGDSETVMAALTRYGASIRDLQSQIQSMMKKTQLKRRKRKLKLTHGSKEEGDSTDVKEAHDATALSKDDANTEAIQELKNRMDQTRKTIEELTEIADALLFGGETEAYELTKMDWIHRYKLAEYFPMSSFAQPKRPMPFEDAQHQTQKKSRVGYFDTIISDTNNTDGNAEQQHISTASSHLPPKSDVTWEYRGNEDGSIHGPYTSRQMLEWTTCGYFIGESAVDIRRVGSNNQSENESDAKAQVDDLMADLLDDDDDDGNEGKLKSSTKASESASPWMRSDEVDFGSYLL